MKFFKNPDGETSETVNHNPDCRAGAEYDMADPGKTIRFLWSLVFCPLLISSLACIIFNYEKPKWGVYSPNEPVVLVGTFLLMFSCTMLLPSLTFAAWRTSRWRCKRAEALQRFPVDELDDCLVGSLRGWTSFWSVLSGIGALMCIALPIYIRYGLDYNHSVINLEHPNTTLDVPIIVSFIGWSAAICEFFAILWWVCLEDQLKSAEETKALVKSKMRGDAKTWMEDQINHLISDMVPIPGKSITMGKFEVTQGQWEAVMGSNPALFKGDDFPVETVSWDDCLKFCSKLNGIPAVAATGTVFRLPTQEEWECACRAGSTNDFCRLSDKTEITEETLCEVAWFGKNSDQRTHAVGQKKPNAFGLYDVHGNVWEWTSTADGEHRIRLGGCWASTVSCCKSTDPSRGIPSDGSRGCGFRLCAEAATK